MTELRVGTAIGPYIVQKALLGSIGGFARVVVARREPDGARVALKIQRVRPDDEVTEVIAGVLLNEAEMLRQLRHPGLMQIFPTPIDGRRVAYTARANDLDGQPWYFAMEFLAGGSVAQMLDAEQPLPVALAVEIAEQVATTLVYLHDNGYAHLDVKLENILLRQPFGSGLPLEAVLIDLGAAQRQGRRADVVAGSRSYLAPERIRLLSEEAAAVMAENQAAADVYALGVATYRMLTGHFPFAVDARSPIESILQAPPPPSPVTQNSLLAQYPGLDKLVLSMLAPEPAARPTARDVGARFNELVLPPRVTDATVSAERERQLLPWRIAIVALMGMCVVLGTALALVLTR